MQQHLTLITLADLDTGGYGADDPRVSMANSIRHGDAVFAALRPDALTKPTPCPDYDTRAMAGHLVAVVRRFAAIAEGVAWEDTPLVVDGIADDAWVTEWQAATNQLRRVFSDESRMDQVLRLPFGDVPAPIAMSIYATEVLTHTWDLSTGLGVAVDWDNSLAEELLPGIQMGLPDEGRELVEMPFSPVVPTASDAPAIERLVAWMGRQP